MEWENFSEEMILWPTDTRSPNYYTETIFSTKKKIKSEDNEKKCVQAPSKSNVFLQYLFDMYNINSNIRLIDANPMGETGRGWGYDSLDDCSTLSTVL